MSMSMRDGLLETRQEWFGDLTLENIEAVYKRLCSMLEGKHYTFVTVNDFYGPLPTPKVRLHQRLSPESSTHGQPVYLHYGDDKSWGFIGVNDTYGAWSISTESNPEKQTHLHFEYNKLTIEHYSTSGNRIKWVIAIEGKE